MKRYLVFMAVLVSLAVSCRKDGLNENERSEDMKYVRTLSVGVSDEEPDTRVGFDQGNAFYWHKGDKIGVQTGAGFMEMTLQEEYAGASSGVFEGNFEEEMGKYVVYPHGENHAVEGDVLTYFLPASYRYASIAEEENSFNPPMYGVVSGGNATLTHLASFFKIYVGDIPAGGDDMELVFTADKRITGEFAVDLTAQPPVMNTDDKEGNTVTIGFSNTDSGADGVFYIPAPLGTYGSITVEVKDGGTSLVSKTWTDQTVSRKTPKKGTVDLEYVAEIDGALYKNLQAAFDAAYNQKITLIKDLDLDAPVVLAQGRKAVFDMNGKSISGTAVSASASNLIAVKSGAELVIRNGTLSFAATTPDTDWGGEGQPPYPGYANNTISNNGTLTIENTFIENRTSKGGASYVIDNYVGSKLIINDGSVITQSGGDIAIRMFNASEGAIDVTVNGGTVTGNRAVWIQLASSNASVAPVMNLTVNDGTLTSTDPTYYMAVYSYSFGNDMKNVAIDVNGGTFNGDIALTGGANKTNIETLNISGGIFNGPWGFYSYGPDEKAMMAIKISGGTFLEEPVGYVADGYVAVQNGDVWTVIPAE